MEAEKLVALTHLKNVISEMKNIPNKVSYNVETIEERISELES